MSFVPQKREEGKRCLLLLTVVVNGKCKTENWKEWKYVKKYPTRYRGEKMWKSPQINHSESRHDWSRVTPSDHVREYICKGPAVSISAPFIWSSSSLHSVFVSRVLWGLDWTHLCAASVRSVSEQQQQQQRWGGLRKRPVDLERSQGQSGFNCG